jgi:hypothetical protein
MKVVLASLILMLCGPAFGQTADIAKAWYDKDSDIYGHRIMGSIAEHLRLNAELTDGTVVTLDLAAGGNPTHVFEDMAPRLADMDGDGTNELVVVETDVAAGAALAIYGLGDGGLKKLAETPHIGSPFRWLAPVGVGDFNGDGRMDVAYVDRPHLAKLLRVWSFDGDNLTEIARASGLTNHRIGDEVIAGGVRTCGGQDQMVLLTGNWKRIVVARFDGGELKLDVQRSYTPAALSTVLKDC